LEVQMEEVARMIAEEAGKRYPVNSSPNYLSFF
jgi:hypothetical protein